MSVLVMPTSTVLMGAVCLLRASESTPSPSGGLDAVHVLVLY